MSALLLPGRPIVILPHVAAEIGLNESIFLQQLHYWLSQPGAGSNFGRTHKNRKWIYNTPESWRETNFPFWSASTIRRIITSLENQGYIATDIEESSDLPGGRRKWFTINYEKAAVIGSAQNEQTGISKVNTPPVQNEQAVYIDTETTTETTTESVPPSAGADAQDDTSSSSVSGKIAKPVQPHIAIIDAWYDGMPAAPIVRMYPRNAKVGKAIAEAGYTPKQVTDFVREKYAEDYWQGKQMPLEVVAKDLPQWVAAHPAPPPPIRMVITDEMLRRNRAEHMANIRARVEAGEFGDDLREVAS